MSAIDNNVAARRRSGGSTAAEVIAAESTEDTRRPHAGLLVLIGMAKLLALIYKVVATVLLAAGATGEVVLIISRNLVGAQPAWSTVASTLALATGGVLYIGLCPTHISFRLVNDRLGRRYPAFRMLSTLMTVAVATWLTYLGVRAVIESQQLGARLQSFSIEVWIPLLSVPLAAAVLAGRFAYDFWLQVKGRTS